MADGPTDSPADPNLPACPFCEAAITPFDHFCPRCRKPLNVPETTDPMVQASGLDAIIQATWTRPSRGVVVTLWTVFVIQALVLLGLLVTGHWREFAPDPDASGSTTLLVITIAEVAILELVYLGTLAAITHRYRTGGRKPSPTDHLSVGHDPTGDSSGRGS